MSKNKHATTPAQNSIGANLSDNKRFAAAGWQDNTRIIDSGSQMFVNRFDGFGLIGAKLHVAVLSITLARFSISAIALLTRVNSATGKMICYDKNGGC